jgi:RNA polymerase sigma factor (sigma-70 family)
MDDDRLRRLAKEFSPAIANYLRRRLYPLSHADMDDLIEETLLVAWRRVDDIPEDAELAWMIGAARNVLSNARRARQRRMKLESRLRPISPAPSAEAWVLASASIREAMGSLRRSDRDILMLHHWDGLDAGSIAIALSISTTAANVRLSRAQARFRAAFAAEDDG